MVRSESRYRLASEAMNGWRAGDHVVLREVRQGRVWSAKPMIVVRDAPDLVALYVIPGTRWKQPQSVDGRRVGITDVISDTWVLSDRTWTSGGALVLHIPGAGYALMGFYDEHRNELLNWYLNLQEPLRRTSIGFDFLDQILDVVVSADRRSWSWKDEDEFAEAQAYGLVDAQTASAIRAEGERALLLLLAGAPPYAVEWEAWEPDSDWTVPKLPFGWDEIVD